MDGVKSTMLKCFRGDENKVLSLHFKDPNFFKRNPYFGIFIGTPFRLFFDKKLDELII